MNRMRAGILTAAVIAAAASPAAAEDFLGDQSVPVERRVQRDYGARVAYSRDTWSMLLLSPAQPELPLQPIYKSLPLCSRSEIRRRELHPQRSKDSEIFDVVYYSAADQAQVMKAKRYRGFSLPYRPGLERA